MHPLPLLSVVLTRTPLGRDDCFGVGIVVDRIEISTSLWGYSLIIGGGEHVFHDHQLIPLGYVADRLILYGARPDIMNNYGRLIYKTETIKELLEGHDGFYENGIWKKIERSGLVGIKFDCPQGDHSKLGKYLTSGKGLIN
ncbi:hypothetical protein [Austwickia chelonae]|uniref:hypothetical protein n=1 Tax=Austwickia chelonae TaxID=100225 RepID=UPI0013C2FC96|nr:hypothetical protein [Austwickia chelonae]